METYIKGTYKRCIFSSNDGYTIGLIKIKETDDQDLLGYIGKQFTFTGLFAGLNMDEDYTFYGNTIDNPKYGIQYKVNRYEKLYAEKVAFEYKTSPHSKEHITITYHEFAKDIEALRNCSFKFRITW